MTTIEFTVTIYPKTTFSQIESTTTQLHNIIRIGLTYQSARQMGYIFHIIYSIKTAMTNQIDLLVSLNCFT